MTDSCVIRCWQAPSFREEYEASAYSGPKTGGPAAQEDPGRAKFTPFSLSTMMMATAQPHGPKTTREALSSQEV